MERKIEQAPKENSILNVEKLFRSWKEIEEALKGNIILHVET